MGARLEQHTFATGRDCHGRRGDPPAAVATVPLELRFRLADPHRWCSCVRGGLWHRRGDDDHEPARQIAAAREDADKVIAATREQTEATFKQTEATVRLEQDRVASEARAFHAMLKRRWRLSQVAAAGRGGLSPNLLRPRKWVRLREAIAAFGNALRRRIRGTARSVRPAGQPFDQRVSRTDGPRSTASRLKGRTDPSFRVGHVPNGKARWSRRTACRDRNEDADRRRKAVERFS